MAGSDNIDQGDRLRDINKLVGGEPPGIETKRTPQPDDPMPRLLKQIGAMVAAKAQTRFKTQEFGGVQWAARSEPNLAGVLGDVEHSSNVKKRRFDDRPANVDTGQLRSSIVWRVIGPKTVQVGTNVQHAGDAQFGGPFQIDITARMKENLEAYLLGHPEHEDSLGFLLREDSISGERPERIFVGLDARDEEKIDKLIEEAFGGGGLNVE